jgi:hypothetical protein
MCHSKKGRKERKRRRKEREREETKGNRYKNTDRSSLHGYRNTANTKGGDTVNHQDRAIKTRSKEQRSTGRREKDWHSKRHKAEKKRGKQRPYQRPQSGTEQEKTHSGRTHTSTRSEKEGRESRQ